MRFNLCIVAIFLTFDKIIGVPVSGEKKPVADIIQQEYIHLPDGGYSFFYLTRDEQMRKEMGYFKYIGDVPILTIEGSYSYITEDGVLHSVSYTADENGYKTNDNAGSELDELFSFRTISRKSDTIDHIKESLVGSG